MIRLSLLMLFCLLLFPTAWAETLVLDSSDIQDWARVSYYDSGKYKDTMIGANALLKFQTHEIPAGAFIDSATLSFKPIACSHGETMNVFYVTDDTWSYDITTAGNLHSWPVKGLIDNYDTG